MSESLSYLKPPERMELLSLLEAQAKVRIRRDFAYWCRLELAAKGLTPAKHHNFIIQELQAVSEGFVPRLMLLMPPGSAKSTFGSKLFPAYWLSRFPRAQIIGGAHTQTLAEKFSFDVQDIIRTNADTLGYKLRTEAKDLWMTNRGGQYRAVGVGSKITGFRANVAILDDLVPGSEAADSPTQRDALWDWYVSELDTRLTPAAPRILIMTRWHEDDIAGRLLRYQPEMWRVVSIPALAGPADPLGRAPGEPLWDDDDYGYGKQLLAKRVELFQLGKARSWNALYQQNPRPPEGALFNPAKLSAVDTMPPASDSFPDVRAWDLAATADGGDATVGLRLRRIESPLAPRWGVVNIVRFRGAPHTVAEVIRRVAQEDGPRVTIRLPQDPGQAGKQQVIWLTGLLQGHRVISAPVTGSKATRASPVASQINVGLVEILRASWNAEFIAELAAFPNGTEDDQVDALSDAYTYLSAPRGLTIPLDALEQSRRSLPRSGRR